MLLAEESPDIFPKHKGYFFSESFALNWYIFIALTNKNYCSHYNVDLEKLIEYWASVVNVVLSSPCVGPLQKIKNSFFLLSICADELISTQKKLTFLPQSRFGSEKNERELNPIP